MAAQYLVTRYPGAYVEHREPNGTVHTVGFVKPNQTFLAPHLDYEPSRHFRAMNAEAAEALKKLKAKLEEHDTKRAKELEGRKDPDNRPVIAPRLALEVNAEIYRVQKETPVVEDLHLSPDELRDLGSPKGSFAFDKPSKKPTRVADR